jgi:uncharacterized membrane protein YphA (DoxX/SURF4 family)
MHHGHIGVTLYILQLLVSLFLAIPFLQSGIDKIVNWKGNLEFLTGHFAKSPLAGFVPLLLFLLTILECASGLVSAIGFVVLIFSHNPAIAFYGAVLSATAVTALFFGQRMAREYPGSAALVPYFIVALAAIYLLGR